MTRPTMICFDPGSEWDSPKIIVRALLYSTSEKGQYIQNMFVKVGGKSYEGGTVFNDWNFGNGKGVTGKAGGLFVDKGGIEKYHHFLLSKSERAFVFYSGEYYLSFFAETVDEHLIKIFEWTLDLKDIPWVEGRILCFDWDSHMQNYHSYPNFPG